MLGLMLIFLFVTCLCLGVQIDAEKPITRNIFAVIGFVCLLITMYFADRLDKSTPKEPTPICKCCEEKIK